MKKILSFIIVVLLGVTTSNAQQRIIIKDSLGNEIFSKYLWEVNDISFVNEESKLINKAHKPTVEQGVNLGICNGLLWAPYNFGESTEAPTGMLFGWGDITGNVKSLENKYYPTNNPPLSITSGKYDVVYQTWGEKWRLPKKSEFDRLLTDCDWKLETKTINSKEVQGWTISRKGVEVIDATNSIFLPMTGKRIGSNDIQKESTNGYYWTGDRDERASDFAFCLSFDATDKSQSVIADALQRYIGAAIRPVYGIGDVEIQFSTPTATTTSIGATIAFDVTGNSADIALITKYGVKYRAKGEEEWIPKSIDATSASTISISLSELTATTEYDYYIYAIVDGNEWPSTPNVLSFTTRSSELALTSEVVAVTNSTATISVTATGDYSAYPNYTLSYTNTETNATKDVTLSALASQENVLTSLAHLTKYTYTITATMDGVTKSCEGEFTTKPNYKVGNYVDLGELGIWSDIDLGATSETDLGGYFYWGDVTGTTAGAGESVVNQRYIGGNAQYDIARAQWKGNWRLPTYRELYNLFTKTERSYGPNFIDKNGSSYVTYKLTAPNGNSIIVKPAGFYDSTGKLTFSTSMVNYWTSNGYTNEVYVSGKVSQIIGCEAKGSTGTGYVSLKLSDDGTTGSTQLKIVRCKNKNGELFSLTNNGTGYTQSVLKVGDYVTLTGEFSYNSSETVAQMAEATLVSSSSYGSVKDGYGSSLSPYNVKQLSEDAVLGLYHKNLGSAFSVGYRAGVPTEISAFATNYRLNVRPIYDGEISGGDSGSGSGSDSGSGSGSDSGSGSGSDSGSGSGSDSGSDSGSGSGSDSGSGSSGDNDPSAVDASWAVDLGLPSGVKWAKCNIGATKEYETGDYYTWGEIKPHASGSYLEKNYPYAGKPYTILGGGNIQGKAEYDAATANWGNGWMMPDDYQLDELIENCNWTYTTSNGVAGYRVSSKVNSNSIFLPMAGYMADKLYGSYTGYWTSKLDSNTHSDKMDYSYYLSLSTSSYSATSYYRENGYLIRAIYKK